MSLFFFQLKNELLKLFARKRTYIGFGAFLAIELLILFMLNLPKPRAGFQRALEQNGYGFDQYFSGLTLGLQIILYTVPLLGSLYLALVAGDVVAKEVEDGTMRMLLCRPISRVRILLLKYLGCLIYTLALILFIGATALAAGVLFKGFGGLLAFSPMDRLFAIYDFGPGLARYVGALLFAALSYASITSLGFLLSCMNMKPAAATIITLSVFFLDFIFHNIPYFESLHPYFITTHTGAWLHALETYIPWPKMVEDYTYLLALDVTFFVLAAAIFHRRDFKS